MTIPSTTYPLFPPLRDHRHEKNGVAHDGLVYHGVTVSGDAEALCQHSRARRTDKYYRRIYRIGNNERDTAQEMSSSCLDVMLTIYVSAGQSQARLG